ncbi:ABC transporter ATP-binding protein [Tunturiibacter empetritectus]
MEGEFYFAGDAVHAMNRKQRAELARRRIGMVFQSYHLLDDLTVAENIDLPLSYKDIPKSERQALVADTLDRFNIVGKKDLFPNQLSGGQQQLVGIARAVIHKPDLLLADEPTGNLHSEQAKEIMQLFRRLNEEGTTVVQVTHSEANAEYGTRTIELRDGWLSRDTAGLVAAEGAGCERERKFTASVLRPGCVVGGAFAGAGAAGYCGPNPSDGATCVAAGYSAL